MSGRLPESARTSSSARHGEFAYPLQAIHLKKAPCLEASRKEHVDDSTFIDVGSHQVRRYVSVDGRLYFGYEQFLSPNNLANNVVFSAFLAAKEQLSQYFAGQDTQPGRFEAVISLQCVSLTEPRFSYYFVDHYLHGVSDESILTRNQTGRPEIDNRGTVRWNVAAYWDHVAIFSAHHLCTTKDYDRVMSGLQSQAREWYSLQGQTMFKMVRCGAALASLDTGNNDTPNDFEVLCSLLSQFDRTNIDAQATVSIARIMKQASGPSPTIDPQSSTIIRSFRGILISSFDRDDAHPSTHGVEFESTPILNDSDTQDRGEGWRFRIGWRGNQE